MQRAARCGAGSSKGTTAAFVLSPISAALLAWVQKVMVVWIKGTVGGGCLLSGRDLGPQSGWNWVYGRRRRLRAVFPLGWLDEHLVRDTTGEGRNIAAQQNALRGRQRAI